VLNVGIVYSRGEVIVSEENSSKQEPESLPDESKRIGVAFMCCLHRVKTDVCGASLNVFGARLGEVQCMYGHRFDLEILRKKFFQGGGDKQ
jgi:hypothetical protein